MVDKINSFEQMNVWQSSMDLAVEIYKLTDNFPKSEQFALTNQLRRASSSISANIAEGFGRQSKKEKIQFYSIAYGSLLETKNFLYLSNRLQYINEQGLNSRLSAIISLQKQLNSLIKSLKNNG